MEDKDLIQKVTQIEERTKSNTKRIEECFVKLQDIQDLAIQIKEIAMEIKEMRKDINKVDDRLKLLEDKPAKRWENLIGTVVTCIATGIVCYFLAKFGI